MARCSNVLLARIATRYSPFTTSPPSPRQYRAALGLNIYPGLLNLLRTAMSPIAAAMGRRSRLNEALDLALQSDAHGPIGGIGLAERSCNSQTGPVLAPPSVSNAVALADILRCPVVVADQAAGQKDVEADLWVRVSAVWMRHSGKARDQRTVMSAGTMAAARGVRAEHSDRARDQRTVVSPGTTAAARGVRAGVGMPEMRRATFPAAAL